MSVFCPKCGKKTFNEYTCDHCGYTIQKKQNIKNSWNTKSNKITIEKNTIIYAVIIMIAISVSYLAYNKYQEKKLANKIFKETFGTTPEEFYNMNDEERKQAFMNTKNTKKIKKELYKQINNFKMIELPINTDSKK